MQIITSFHIALSKFNFTVQVNYEASGWVAHQVTDIWAKSSPDRGDPVWALWPMGGAWLSTHLWEHYTFTMDKVSPVSHYRRKFGMHYISFILFVHNLVY